MDLMELVAKISLDSSEYDRGIKSISAGAVAVGNLISSGFQAAGQKISSFAHNVMESGMSFESVMSKVSAISGSTGSDIESLSAKAQEMGAKTKFSATEAGEAMTYMAMAGWKTNDMLNGIEGIMNLAAASGENLATTSDIVTDALTALGLKAEDSGHFADILAVASSNANTNVSLMGETFKYVAPVAGALGYSAEDLAKTIGLVANAGIKGSQAGTSLRTIITRLSTDAGGSAKSLGALGVLTEKLGVQFYNTDGSTRALNDVLSDARVAWARLSEEEQINYGKTIAGQEGMSAWLALMNAAPEDIAKLEEALKNADGAAESMATTMNQNLSGSLTILGSATESLALAFYNGISVTAKEAVDGLTAAVGVMTEKVRAWIQSDATQEKLGAIAEKIQVLIDKLVSNLDPILDTVINLFDKLVTAISFAIDNFDSIVAIIGTLVGAFATMKTVMATLNIAQFIISPAGAAVAGITALIAILKACGVTMDDVKKVFVDAWNAIKSAWSAVQPFFSQMATAIKSVFNAAVPAVTDIFKKAWNEIKTVWNLVKPFFETLGKAIKSIFQVVAPFLSSVFKTAWNDIKAVWDAAVSFFKVIWEGIKAVFAVVKGVLTGDFSDAWEGIKNVWSAVVSFFQTIFNSIKSIFSGIPSVLSGLFKSAWEAVKLVWDYATMFFRNIFSGIQQAFSGIVSFFSTTFSNAWNAIKNAWSNVGSFFSGVRETIKGALSNLGEQAKSWGADMINGFKKGIENAKAGLQKAASGVAQTIRNIFHFSRPDEGPLRDYETWMPDFVKGMAKGLEANIWRLEDASRMAANSISSSLGNAGNIEDRKNAASGNNTMNISININGAQYNNEQSLAEAISFELQNLMNRRKAVFA